MPGPLNAQAIVLQTRIHCQLISTNQYRDGFPTDPSTSSDLIPILSFVNQALAIIARTGVVQSEFSVATVSGTYRYPVPSGAGRILDISYPKPNNGGIFSLVDSTLDNMNQRNPGWRSIYGTPNIYMPMGTEIYLYPVPTMSGPMVFRTPSQPSDLFNTTDIPSAIPPFYHNAICLLAAMFLCASDADNASRAARLPFLVSMWEAWYSDLDGFVRARTIFSVPGTNTLPQTIAKQEGGV